MLIQTRLDYLREMRMNMPLYLKEIAAFLGVTPDYAASYTIAPLLYESKLIITIPDKPKSKL